MRLSALPSAVRSCALLALLLAGCSDYSFKPAGAGNEGATDSGGPPGPSDGGGTLPGDGGSDEDCTVDEPPAGTARVDEDCVAPDLEVLDPWNVMIEWQYTVRSGTGVIVMPAIGNLTDDNGDGRVDQDDRPDIAFTTWGANTLVALHGDGSGTIFEVSGFDGNGGVAIADVDNDGAPEVIAPTTDKRVAAVNGAGTTEWRSAPFAWQMYPQPVIADLEGDGDVEIVMDIAVVEGSGGATVATLSGITSSWRAPVTADVDADGTQEILLGEIAYDHRGAREWSVSRTGDSTFQAVADIDGDAGGETFWVTGSQLHIVDDDGRLIRTVNLNSGSTRPGPPSVADFDGDGQVEVAVPASTMLEVFEVDGTRLWQAAIQDASGIAGASGYDVDGDGAYEVLYADEVQLRIFDGRTGTQRYANSSHTSGTVWEYPTVADVDNDGSAEIVIASNGSRWKGVTVLGHAGDGWAKSGTTWPVHDFAMTQVEPDGHVPSPAARSWDVYNVFRARPTVDDAAIDLSVEIVDSCFAGCEADSYVALAVQVANVGGLPSNEGIPVALYAMDGGAETLLEVKTLPRALEPGTTSAAIVFETTRGQMGPEGFMVRVDDAGGGIGAQNECDEGNNEAWFTDWPC
ncbi:FG-GAP-like repeat-containing protein [Myxococcota bacterium]|nr:FG-GAP-like repeat-containing protein [Myxococcota bacterium]